MIIRKLKLHPFAGLTNQTIEFNEGLSVVCGPNEAGKSTTVRALYFALFIKTNLT
ncbi:MAG: AAA family ATPase, partial [Nitrosopumilus sp.]|nr:AAA family ATPase [Nitrosopumilus sp.]